MEHVFYLTIFGDFFLIQKYFNAVCLELVNNHLSLAIYVFI